jgi:uncharacterized protein (DUF2267 family)
MDERELTRMVKSNAGLRSSTEAHRAIASSLGAVRCALDDADARALARVLPRRFGRVLEQSPTTTVRSASELYEENRRRENVAPGFAVEHAQVVLQALARSLDASLLVLLRRRLPEDIASLLEWRLPEIEEAPPVVHVHPPSSPRPEQAIGRVRPGTADPIAEARHPLAHSGSVARTPAPHADTMVETARSSRPGREDDTLASTRNPGSRR